MNTLRALSDLPSYPKSHEPEALETEKPQWTAKQIKNIGKAINQLASHKAASSKQRELVAGGVILWKPVDRVAAKMLTSKKTDMAKTSIKGMGTTDLITGHAKTREDLNLEIGHYIIKKAKNMSKDLKEFSAEVATARQALEEATDRLRTDVVDFVDEFPAVIKKLREYRMAVTNEKALTLSALQDVRKFFLDNTHEQEMQRLRDFVGVAERLSKLAADGTLDKIADVMLKLA